MKMKDCEEPPSELFTKIKGLNDESVMQTHHKPLKVRRTNQAQSQNMHKPKMARRSAQPLSYQPIKMH